MQITSRGIWLRLRGPFCSKEVEDISIMDCTEKQRCLLCKSTEGEMLPCNDDDCLIFVHKSCMGCKPYVDGMGNFYCPYCFYKRFTSEEHISKKRAIVRGKNLSIFLEKENSNGSPDDQDNSKEIPSKDKTCLEDHENNRTCDDHIQIRYEETHKQTQGSPNKSGGVDDHTGNIINNQEVAQEDSSDRGTLTPFRKIGRVLWTEEEVQMLKEGVEKHSQTAHKKLSWKKILEFGHDVFDPSRTPSDLKDKWRSVKK